MTAVLDKLERLTQMAERLEGLVKHVPRLAEMFGVAMFAGRAAERLGGRFADGVLSGVVADGLVHSNLPHNQYGGITLGAYFAGLGLLNIAPPMVWEGDPVTPPGEEPEPVSDYDQTWLDWWGNFIFPPRPAHWKDPEDY